MLVNDIEWLQLVIEVSKVIITRNPENTFTIATARLKKHCVIVTDMLCF